MILNKRYKDLFEQYIHHGESTPFTLGTIVICGFCFLALIVATFSQINISHFWIVNDAIQGWCTTVKTVAYNPQIPVFLLILYILGRNFSMVVFILYLIIGLFFCPIFAFGGGIEYVQNYFFGYMVGYLVATVFAGNILNKGISFKNRFLASIVAILTIHLCVFLYCIVLAMFRVIDFSLIIPIVAVLSFSKILYDLFFGLVVMAVAPYIKNVVWICMRPAFSSPKLKNSRKRHQIVSDNAD